MQALSRSPSQATATENGYSSNGASSLKRSFSSGNPLPAQATSQDFYLKFHPDKPAPLELDPSTSARSTFGTSGHLTRHILKILRSTLRTPASQTKTHTVVFRLRWGLDLFIDDQLQGCFDDLDDTITLTSEVAPSGEFHTVALPCGAYVKRQWPSHGQFLLDVLKRAHRDHTLSGKRGLAGEIETDGDLSIRVFYKQTGTSVAVSGQFKSVFDTFHQLCWMAAVCRSDVHGPVAFSQAWPRYFQTASVPDILINTGDLVPLSGKNEDACWHGLFSNTPCAYGFSVPARLERNSNVLQEFNDLAWGKVGVGLELPFELMTLMAGIKYPFEVEQGIVLVGPSCVLVPTGSYGCVIQWHLYEMPCGFDSSFEELRSYLLNTKWFQCGELTRLTKARTFLAYASKINSRLGTRDSGYDHITRCTAKAEPTSLHISSLSATMGTEGTGIFGANAGATFKLTRGLRANIRSNLLSDCDRLYRSERQPAVIYDETAGRAWLVPELSLILHALHSWATSRHLEECVPFAEVSHDGGEAARMAILRSASQAVEGQPDGREITVMEKTSAFLDMLQQRKESSLFRKQDGGHRLFNKSSELLAWDYRELVEMKAFPQRRQVKLPSSLLASPIAWPKLLNDPEIMVFVCGRLGDPFIPAPSAGLCVDCATVPRNGHVLVASMRCLNQLDVFRGGALQGLKWRDPSGDQPFHACEDHRGGMQQRVQFLQSASGQNWAPWWVEEAFPDGALIFGGSKTSLPSECSQTQSISREKRKVGGDKQTIDRCSSIDTASLPERQSSAQASIATLPYFGPSSVPDRHGAATPHASMMS